MMRAQENAELTGSVTDPSGAVIPNAQLAIANTGTGESHSATGNYAGFYGFSGLSHGVYTHKTEARGFIRSVLAAEP